MPFRPSVNDTLTVDGVVYRFTEHPAARSMPYGQSGRKGTVYQLQEQDDREHALHALKVFVRAHREPRIATVAERLRQFAGLPGLAVCDREAITPERHAALLASEPDLTYAVLMPWIAGTTWQEIVLGRQPLKEAQSREIAQRLALILATMEAQEIAHCDLSGPNVMVALRAQPGPAVQLVDVEDLYAPGLPVPARPSSGSAGYGHREGAENLWRADADRFAGAVLLAEMLGWWDNTVRVIAAGESYFDADELQQHGERFQVLVQSLGSKWGAPVADLFSRAWHSASLADCPSFAEWSRALGTPEVESKERPARRRLEEAEKLTARGDTEGAIRALEEANRLAPELAALPYVHALQRRAEARERASDMAGALADYRAAHAAAPPGAHRNELADIVRLIQSQLPASAPAADDTEAVETEAARLQAEAAARAAEAARQQAAQEAEARERAAREQAAREQAAREQAAREQAAREQAAREEAARRQAEEQARREAALAAERAAAEARRAAEEEARRSAEAEARRAAEEQAQRDAARAAEIEAEQRREAEARQQAAELERRRAAEAEALRRREQEAREAAAARQQEEAIAPPGPRPWPRPLVALAVVVILVANFILFGVLSSRSASSAPVTPSFVAAQMVQGPAPALPVA